MLHVLRIEQWGGTEMGGELEGKGTGDMDVFPIVLTGLCRIPPSQKLMAEATKKEQLIER